MPDLSSNQRLKKKALERWENEGGRIDTDAAAMNTSSPPRSEAARSNAPAADRRRSNGRKK
jgi:hypothetical protein